MSNAQKTPLGHSLNRIAIARAGEAIQKLGKALPCSVVKVSGAIITVKFEVQSGFTLPNVAIPLFGPEYIRYPIKAGDKGVAYPCAVNIGNMSGLGPNTPSELTEPGNLGALVFFPIGNSSWSAVDANAVTVYGPNGVVIRDSANQSSVVVLPGSVVMTGRDSITLVTGSATLTLSSAGAISLSGATTLTLHGGSGVSISDNVHATNLVTMNSVFASLVTFINSHVHTDPQGGNTGAPTTTFTGNIVS